MTNLDEKRDRLESFKRECKSLHQQKQHYENLISDIKRQICDNLAEQANLKKEITDLEENAVKLQDIIVKKLSSADLLNLFITDVLREYSKSDDISLDVILQSAKLEEGIK